MLQAGVIASDYTTLMMEILKDNARLEAGEVYGAYGHGSWALASPGASRVEKEEAA